MPDKFSTTLSRSARDRPVKDGENGNPEKIGRDTLENTIRGIAGVQVRLEGLVSAQRRTFSWHPVFDRLHEAGSMRLRFAPGLAQVLAFPFVGFEDTGMGSRGRMNPTGGLRRQRGARARHATVFNGSSTSALSSL